MIKGILFFEQGGLQVIGELNSLAGIIATLKEILPQLEKQEMDRLFNTLDVEQLTAMIKQRESQQMQKVK